jgi:hypothetical protein
MADSKMPTMMTRLMPNRRRAIGRQATNTALVRKWAVIATVMVAIVQPRD